MANWRDKVWNIASKIGNVADVKQPEVLSQDPAVESISNTSATVDMEQENRILQMLNQKYSSFVKSAIPSGFENTGWTWSLQNLVGQPSVVSAEFLPLELLEESLRNKLEQVAEGIGCDPWEMIIQICSFYVDNEANIVDGGSIYDAVVMYLTNEVC